MSAYKKIKMDQLRAAFETLGFEQVKTYIQSGNVVFKAASASPAALCKKIEKKIQDEIGHSVSVIVRSAGEMEEVVANNPFLKDKNIDHGRLHVMFLTQAPSISVLEQLRALASSSEQLRCLGQEIYLYLPHGVAESFVMKKPVDRLLAVATTMRNWRTVNAIHQMCADCR